MCTVYSGTVYTLFLLCVFKTFPPPAVASFGYVWQYHAAITIGMNAECFLEVPLATNRLMKVIKIDHFMGVACDYFSATKWSLTNHPFSQPIINKHFYLFCLMLIGSRIFSINFDFCLEIFINSLLILILYRKCTIHACQMGKGVYMCTPSMWH